MRIMPLFAAHQDGTLATVVRMQMTYDDVNENSLLLCMAQ